MPRSTYNKMTSHPTGLSKLVPDLRWIIDSGATDHIVSTPNLLNRKVIKPSMPPVLLPSGTGTLSLNSYLYLREVLCVPTF